jgi:hypothetical protein
MTFGRLREKGRLLYTALADPVATRHGISAPPPAIPRHPQLDRKLATLVLVVGILRCAQVLWESRGYVPMWDARIYAMCAVSAAARPFSMDALRCAGHPSEAYIGVLSAFQRLDLGNPRLLHLANALLLCLAAAAFARLLRRTFPAGTLAPERALLLTALILDPAVLSALLHVNVDTGVLVFLLCASAALAEDRRALAIVFGLLASYSKETGALLYAALAGTYALVVLLPRPTPAHIRNALICGGLSAILPALIVPWGPWSVPLALGAALAGARLGFGRPWHTSELSALGARAVPLTPLFLPSLVYGVHLVWHVRQAATGGLWIGTTGTDIAQSVLTAQLGPISRTYLALIFVLTFHWLISAIIGADLLLGVRRYVSQATPRPVPGAVDRPLVFLLLFAAGAVYLVTRFETLVIARYMTPVFPYVLVAFLAALLRLRLPIAMRRVTMAGFVLLLAWSAHRTVDPVSRALFGTYPFGRRAMLHVNSFAGTCCGYGLNQTIYNLEFLRFADAMQAALNRLHPAHGDVVLSLPGPADWLSIGPLDSASQRQLVPRPVAHEPLLYRAVDLATWSVPVDSAWLIEVAYFRADEDRKRLAERFLIGPPDSIWVDGYGVAIRRLTRRVSTTAHAPRADSVRGRLRVRPPAPSQTFPQLFD